MAYPAHRQIARRGRSVLRMAQAVPHTPSQYQTHDHQCTTSTTTHLCTGMSVPENARYNPGVVQGYSLGHSQ
eukprot:2131906-Rhodomonas_salina.2